MTERIELSTFRISAERSTNELSHYEAESKGFEPLDVSIFRFQDGCDKPDSANSPMRMV